MVGNKAGNATELQVIHDYCLNDVYDLLMSSSFSCHVKVS